MSNILKGLNENYSRDEENQQNAMDTRRSSDLSRERNAGLNEPDELPTSSAETRNGVYEYNVPEGQEKLAQDLGLQYHKGHWVSRIPFQRADFQFGRPQFHEIPAKGVAETNVAKYKDMGATNSTTHFIKNVTTGKIVSPHRSRQDAEDALVASLRDSNDEFKIVRARKSGVAEGGEKDRQWSNKDMERLRVATKDFDDIMASDGPDQTKHDLIKKRIQTKPMTGPKGQLPEQGVAEGSLNEGQYEMMMSNGQVKKFTAKDDADAKRIAAGHGAKSVIKLRGGVPAGKVSEQGVAEGSAEAPLKHHTATVSYHKKDDPHRRYEARFKTTHNLGKEETEKRAKAAFAAKGKVVYNIVHEQGVAEGAPTTWEVSFDYGPHMSKTVSVKADSEEEAIAKVEKAASKKPEFSRGITINWARPAEQEQLDELSNKTLASYKKKAGEYASAADKAAEISHKGGEHEVGKRWTDRADKRFSGIVKATKKQFDNDAEGINESDLEEGAMDSIKSGIKSVSNRFSKKPASTASVMPNTADANTAKQAVDKAVAVVKTVDDSELPKVVSYGKQQFDSLSAPTPASDANTIAAPVDTRASIPQTTTPSAPVTNTTYAQIKQLISKMDKKGKQRLLAVINKSLGVSESIDEAEGNDPWGPQGNFAGDTKVDVGGITMKKIQAGDDVKYFGEKARVVEVNHARNFARISANGKTLNVRLSDLTQLGQGMAEEELDEAKAKKSEEDIFLKGKKVGSITTTTTKGGITFYTAQVGNSYVAGSDTREEALKHLKRLYRDYYSKQGVAEGLGNQPAPKSLGKFLYNVLTKGLEDINIPYQPGSVEYKEFVNAYKQAYVDQDRRHLRLSMNPGNFARYLNIPNYEMYIQNAEKQGMAEAGNKPLEKSRFGTGDTRTPRDIKSQMSGASDEFVRSTADKTTGPFHSKVAKMQNKMAKSELRKRDDHDRLATGTNEEMSEEKQRLDPSCWKGYKKQGTKMKGDTRVNNCVPVKESNSSILEGLQQVDEINWKHAAAAGAMALGALGGAGQAQAQFNPAGLSTVYLQQVVSGEHQRPAVSVDAAKAELQARADGKQQKVSSQSDTSNKPFTPVDYQTKEPLKKGPDGKWYNSNGEERDGLHGGPMSSQGTAMFRSLKPRQ